MGDVEYLATETLKETDWTVESEKFVERVDEALIYVQLPANDESADESIKSWWENTTIHKLKDDEEDFLQEGLEDSEVTDKSAFYKATILAFYSSCRNKPHRFQFIYLTDYSKANVSIDKNRQILNKNC
jgi:exoribonuclease II